MGFPGGKFRQQQHSRKRSLILSDILQSGQADSTLYQELADLLNKYGSDKSSVHNYDLLYAHIFADFNGRITNLLEIGIGTPDDRIISNMGGAAQPGVRQEIPEGI